MALTSTFTRFIRFQLDKVSTLSRQSASGAQPEPLKRIARGVLLVIGIALCSVPYAGSSEQMLHKEYITPKEYSLYLLDFNKEQYVCLSILYGKESAWNERAQSGSHYGIAQMRSEFYRDLDGYDQVIYGLKYIDARYDNDTCKALAHWKKYGWH